MESFFEFGINASSKNGVPVRISNSKIPALVTIVMFKMIDSHIFDPFDVDLWSKVTVVVQTFVKHDCWIYSQDNEGDGQ